MHRESYKQMGQLLGRWMGPKPQVLDVGSCDVNGTFKPLIVTRGWKYTGLDVAPGPNVDIVSLDPYNFPIEDNAYDIVISGSTMEHVPEIWNWVPELARVLRPGGMLCVITHTSWPFHQFPIDCWRIMPDGMKYLVEMAGTLEKAEVDMYNKTDISLLAWKQAKHE